MRRAVIVLGWILAIAIALPLILLGVANTGPGRYAIEYLAAWGSGDTVRISSLAGRFPDGLRAAQLELRDRRGAYATLRDVELDWSPSRLTTGVLAIDRVSVRVASISRQPDTDPGPSSTTTGLPVRVFVQSLHIDRLEVAAPVIGADAVLTVDASGALDSLTTGRLLLTARTPDEGGEYRLDATADSGAMRVSATVNEPAHGWLSRLADVPDLGAIALNGALEGPRSALATRLTLTAGLLRASAAGQIDLVNNSADLTIEANAPEMRPGPDLAWQSVALNARVHGRFTAPDAIGQLRIDHLTAGDAGIDKIAADLSGNTGEAKLLGTITGARQPGPGGALFAESPIRFEATARLDAPERPVRFSLHHELLTVEGSAVASGPIRGSLTVTVPEVSPFLVAVGGNLKGNLAMTLTGDATQVTVDGTLGVTGGPGPALALLGDAARFKAAATLRGQTVSLSEARLDGRHVSIVMAGTVSQDAIGLNGTAWIDDLAALRPDFAGALRIEAKVQGPPDKLAVSADLTGSVATSGLASGPLTAHLDAHGLPGTPEGTLTASGDLFGAPLALRVTANRQGDAIRAVLERADWKSAHGEGALSLSTADARPEGRLSLTIGRLDDLTPLTGQRMTGEASATVNLTGQQVRLDMALREGSMPGAASVSRATLNATIDDLAGRQVVDATLALDGVGAGGLSGSATVRARGSEDAVALTLSASVPNLDGAPLRLTGGGTLDGRARRLVLASLEAGWRQRTLRLLAPARITYADGVAIDRLRLGLDKAVLDAAGRLAPTLDLTATLRDLPISLAEVFVPGLAADGTIGAEARLTGKPARPDGTIKLTATGLRLREGYGRTLPPARIDATATLASGAARVDVHAVAGASRLTVTGRAPMSVRDPLDLRVTGSLDIGLLDPLLAAGGQHIAGKLALNTAIAGSIADPVVSGGADATDGEVRDDVLGARINAIKARLDMAGHTLRLTSASGQAGPGTISAEGTVDLLSPGTPIDLRVTARNARPVASDGLTALIDGDFTLRGPADSLTVGGSILARRVDFRVPEKLPASVVAIAIRDPDKPPPPAAGPVPAIALDMTLDAPSQVFLRGRGLDVELGGTVRLQGTIARPRAIGSVTLRRGMISFAGQTLTFTRGTIDFNGAKLTDPALSLVSTSTSASVAATLTVGGTAHAPKITLTSVPELPQDEILAQLLFKRSVSSLGPFELAQIAAALASLTGVTTGLDDPLDRMRRGLGLDRLSAGTNARGSPTLEAGRFLAPGVYVGAKQGSSGGSTQGTVRIDIAKGLKLEGTTGSGGSGSATGAGSETNGSSVGLGYEFEY